MNVKPTFYFRYVDDIILRIPSNSTNHILNIFNEYDKNLQFTVELSQKKNISFLDIKIIIDNQRYLITNWYQKLTFSGRYLNYNSHHPHSYKIAIIYCLVDRAVNLSHTKVHNQNILFIKKVSKQNDYPQDIIALHIKKRIKKIRFTEKNCEKTIENNKGFICLPYVKQLEDFNNFFKKYSTKVVYSVKNKLNNIIKLGKDKNDKSNNGNVVYKINCNNYNASYVGQKSRRVNVRIKEHIKKYTDKDTNSGLFAHSKNNNHLIDFKNIRLRNSQWKETLFRSSFHTHPKKLHE